MSLNKQQFRFTHMLAQLIDYAYKNGYTLTLGEAYTKRNFHKKRLAIDLNLFKNGVYLKETSDHAELGAFWTAIGGTWGGRWDDGNHYSLGEV